MHKNLILLFCLIVITAMKSTWAREPAVDPVRTLKIDSYETKKDQVKGFDFNNQKESPADLERQSPQGLPIKDKQFSANSSPSNILIFILAVIPFAFWFGIMVGMKPKKTASKTNEETLEIISQERDDDDDDFDLPKSA